MSVNVVLPAPSEGEEQSRPASCGRFAAFLEQRKDRICAEWLDAVRGDKGIPSTEANPDPLLIDHVPNLLDDLARIVRAPLSSPLISPEAVQEAQEHGIHRFEQGYDLGEMLRELSVLRTIVIRHTGEFAEADESFRGKLLSNAMSRIHQFIDESLRWSTFRFVSEQQRMLNEANESRMNVLNGVSHELGNALNGIGFAVRMLSRCTPDQIHQVEQSVRRGVQFMTEMLDDLRELARLEAGDEKLTITRFAPLSLVQDIAAIYGRMAEEKGLQLSYDVDPGIPEAVSDERRLRQVAVNLVSNAVKYTASGEIRIECREMDGDRWTLSVEDTGVGIAKEHQEKIFHEFFRVNSTSAAEGMGLGLAVATRQVQLLGGSIRLESEPGNGCRFEVCLPKVLPKM